ncbi:MAG TPA: GNAT family N-acetyltransferase [Gaiellaceae bacterium]|jgi:GNAT superfamily N-acetyltransferase|nr:GNAT family N-acetyltransferase [Gaiellaceae bacterium]
MTVRTATPDDAPAVVAVTGPIDTTSLATPSSFRALLERPAASSTERLVAEVDGEVAAWCPSGMYDDGRGWFWIGVAPTRRRNGIGAALFERLAARLANAGARAIETQINDEDGRRFLLDRGFERTNLARMQSLDLLSVSLPEPAVPAVPLSELDARTLYDLYAAARSDVPTRTPRNAMTRAEFERDVLGDELLDPEVSGVIVENGEPVAFAFVETNRVAGRGLHTLTGVRRDARGRGLGTAVKVAVLRRALHVGLATMITTNDVENGPMLAINRKLGYEPSVLVETYEREL